MANDWIIDVLADLRTFAENNGLTVLASQLDDVSLVAAAEIASLEGSVCAEAQRDAGHVGTIYRTYAESDNAR